MNWTSNGGKSFSRVGEQYKHVDNHSMWIDPNDPNYFLVGCDGGIYESFDAAKHWKYITSHSSLLISSNILQYFIVIHESSTGIILIIPVVLNPPCSFFIFR